MPRGTLCDAGGLCGSDSDIFSNVRQLIVIGITSPTGSCKRGSSTLRCIESHMRASMGQDRPAGLKIMAVHSSHAQQVDTQVIVKNYIQANARRLFCQSVMFDYNWNSPIALR